MKLTHRSTRNAVLPLLLTLAAACGPSPSPGDVPRVDAVDGASQTDGSRDGAVIVDADLQDAPAGDPCSAVRPEAADLANYDAVVRCLREQTASAMTRRSAIDVFVRAVESHGGFPIVATDRVVFVYVNDPAWDVDDDADPAEDWSPNRRRTPLRVAGSFNGWNANELELQSESEGFFHRAVTMSVTPAQRAQYKFIARDDSGTDVWFSDPLSRRFEFDTNGRISLIRGDTTRGHLEWLRDVRATQLNVTRNIVMYVPRGYDWNSERIPVLYMHDGNNLFDTHQVRSAPATWDVDAIADTEINAGNVRPFLVVGMPNNGNRFGEYTHTQDTVSGRRVGGDGDAYADFVVRDLKPLIDARYRTLADRDHTGVLGSSLGGLISFHIGLRHPEVFRFVGGMSSTFSWGDGLGNPTMPSLFAASSALMPAAQVFYLDSGGGPGTGGSCTVGGSDNYCSTLEMQNTLENKGFRTYPNNPNATPLAPANINIFHYWAPNEPHNEAAWHDRLHRVLRLFFRP